MHGTRGSVNLAHLTQLVSPHYLVRTYRAGQLDRRQSVVVGRRRVDELDVRSPVVDVTDDDSGTAR